MIEIRPDAPRVESGVVDLGERRQIRSLEAKVKHLEEMLVEQQALLKPAMQVVRGKHGPGCTLHLHVLVDDKADRVECAHCGEPLVAIEVLRQYAHDELRFVSSLNSLREERARLAREVEALKKRKQSLLSQNRKREGMRKCCRCSMEYERELERCPSCAMPSVGPGQITVPL